jgi:alpha-D-ribose 1-methylphosphonate 5-triphosphate diphosphatase
MSDPLTLRFAGGEALIDGQLTRGTISISDGRISATGGREVDATGYLILPGIIDLHGDGHERHFAPRRGVQNDPATGLHATEAEVAANGITTAMLAQFYSWEGGMRGPQFAAMVSDAVASTQSFTDLHIQLRMEICLHAQFADIAALIDRAGIGYVVLNDHLPHAALAAGKRPPRLTGQALKSGRSPEAHLAVLHALHSDMDAARAALPAFTQTLRDAGVRIGSHDDHTEEDRAQNRAWGADICEFPETRAAAEAARANEEPVIMGAPNVVRGGSHDKKVRAMELIEDGLVTALVSDYHYPAMHRAALKLWDEGMTLEAAWALVARGPAQIMGWQDRGVIATDMRADLCVINAETRRVEATICAGQITHLTGAFAARMVTL